MRRGLVLLPVCLVLLSLLAPVHAEDDDEDWAFRRDLNERYPAEFRIRVNEAIQKGVAWLAKRQRADGSWQCEFNARYPLGPTALATLTLLKGGKPADCEAIRKAFAYMRAQPLSRTYSVAVLLMALDAKYAPARDPFVVEKEDRYGSTKRRDPCAENISKADRALMRRGVKFLIDNQNADGVWRYPNGGFDLSNTQYALLGLKAALRCGIKIPTRVWLDALEFLLEWQEDFGKPVLYRANEIRGKYRISWTEKALARGFRYRENMPITGSMTTAGLAGLIICQTALWESRRFTGKVRDTTRAGIRDAMAWMQTYFTVSTNPVLGKNQPQALGFGIASPWHYYYLYGLERAGILGRIRHFGETDWYEEGAEYLIHEQQSDGGWPVNRNRLVDSCFAILFLKKATSHVRVPAITPHHEPRPRVKPESEGGR